MRKDEFPIVDKLVKDSINEVLDKIRAEINAEMRKMYMFRDYTNGLAKAFEIIDKYRKEHE